MSKEVFDSQPTVEYGFSLKLKRDMTRTYSQIDRTDKYLQFSSFIWTVWPNVSVFGYELSACGFESSCRQLNFKFRAYLAQVL